MNVEQIDYEIDGKLFEGRLVYTAQGQRPLPGLLLCPNWMGVTDDAIERAKAFAGRGHVVLIVDIYGKGVRPADHEQAAALANPLRANPALVRIRMLRALEVLEAEGGSRGLLANGLRASLGFCFGAGNALELARAGAPIKAAIAIHGDLATSMPAEPGVMRAAALSLQGALDPIVPLEHRTAFEEEMQASGAFWQTVLFGNALHAYTDKGIDIPGVAMDDRYAATETYRLVDQFLADAYTGKLTKERL